MSTNKITEDDILREMYYIVEHQEEQLRKMKLCIEANNVEMFLREARQTHSWYTLYQMLQRAERENHRHKYILINAIGLMPKTKRCKICGKVKND